MTAYSMDYGSACSPERAAAILHGCDRPRGDGDRPAPGRPRVWRRQRSTDTFPLAPADPAMPIHSALLTAVQAQDAGAETGRARRRATLAEV
jgi:hypothetical protein